MERVIVHNVNMSMITVVTKYAVIVVAVHYTRKNLLN
jgi:hypothetical protein